MGGEVGDTLLSEALCHLTDPAFTSSSSKDATAQHIWVTIAIHLHPHPYYHTEKLQLHLFTKYIHTNKSFKTHL